MRNVLCLVLAILLVVPLTACGKDLEPASTTAVTTEETTEETTVPTETTAAVETTLPPETTVLTEPTTVSTTEAVTEPTEIPTTVEETTEPSEETETTENTNTQDYILNKNSKKFHHPTCSSVDSMKESNKEYYTGTRDDLIARGYSPCGRCDP